MAKDTVSTRLSKILRLACLTIIMGVFTLTPLMLWKLYLIWHLLGSILRRSLGYPPHHVQTADLWVGKTIGHARIIMKPDFEPALMMRSDVMFGKFCFHKHFTVALADTAKWADSLVPNNRSVVIQDWERYRCWYLWSIDGLR